MFWVRRVERAVEVGLGESEGPSVAPSIEGTVLLG